MRFTAFEPPPPTPTTTIRAETSPSPFTVASCRAPQNRHGDRVSLREEAPQPLFEPGDDAIADRTTEVVRLREAPLQEADARRVGRVADRFDESEHPGWRSDANRSVEHFLRQAPDALKLGRAA